MALWWQQQEMIGDLQEILSHGNAPKHYEFIRNTQICEYFFHALNKAWSAYNREKYDPQNQKSDVSFFTDLIRKGMMDNSIQELLSSKEIGGLAKLKPSILDHKTLRENRYKPNAPVEPDLQKLAAVQHQEFKDLFSEYQKSPAKAGKELVRKLARLLYVVGSNIAHSEKTPYGPDRTKMERDEVVSGSVIPVQKKILDLLFDNPNQKLVVYGTLAPNEPNEGMLKDLQGTWLDSMIRGKIEVVDGLKHFEWIPEAGEIHSKIFFSSDLPSKLPSLDSFEGSNYSRIWIPALVDGLYHVACVYSRAFSTFRN